MAMCSFAAPAMAQQQQPDRQFVVYFRDGDAALTRDADALVDKIVAIAREHRPIRIELIGVNDGLSTTREHIADERAAAIAQSLAKAGVDPAIITRAGMEKPAGAGIAAHEVVVRSEAPSDAAEQIGSLE